MRLVCSIVEECGKNNCSIEGMRLTSCYSHDKKPVTRKAKSKDYFFAMSNLRLNIKCIGPPPMANDLIFHPT